MQLVNLTPHAIILAAIDGTRTTIPPSGTVARVSSTPGQPQIVDGVPVPVYTRQTWGDVVGIPDATAPIYRRRSDGKMFTCEAHEVSIGKTRDTYTSVDGSESIHEFDVRDDTFDDPIEDDRLYIVSALVIGRVKRTDCVAPGTGPNDGAIRNAAGQIEAVTRLVRG